MTPATLDTFARQSYNAVNDTHFIEDEMMNYIYQASMILATEAKIIQGKDTSTSTVVGTRTYNYPIRFIAPTRIEYNSMRLDPIEFIEDDILTLSNSASTSTGTPRYYAIWNKVFYLRPIPDAIQTLTIYGYKEPATVAIADSVLEIPSEFHTALSYYMLFRMCVKDANLQLGSYYQQLWSAEVERAKRWQREREVTDQFEVVKDYQAMPFNITSLI